MRQEWAAYAQETEQKMEQFLFTIDRYETNIALLNQIMPVLAEIVCINSVFFEADLLTRTGPSKGFKTAPDTAKTATSLKPM